MTAVEDLAKARARLLETLSGRKPLPTPSTAAKHNETDITAGYDAFAAQIKLNASKKELVKSLSHGLKGVGFDDGVVVIELTHDQIAKQQAAKAELRERLAGRYHKGMKLNQCPLDDNISGKTDVTKDSPITPFGVAFTPPDMPITARCGTITYQDLMDEQDSDDDSPSPAVTSGRDGTSNWSPRDHQDADFDGDDQDEDVDPAAESASILASYTNINNGRINKYASQHFLTVNGDGTSPSHYAVPLSRMNRLSNQPEYLDKFLDEAFAIAAGRDSGLANYGKMSRVIRIKQRNKMPLTQDQQDHVQRHMSAVEPTAEERIDAATGRTQ